MARMSAVHMGQKRHWLATLWLDNETTEEQAEIIARRLFQTRDLRYGICQMEMPHGNKPHLQIYFEFHKSLRMTEVKKRCGHPTIHLEPRLGSRADARSYSMSVTWKGKDKGVIGGPWHQGEWISDVRGSNPARKSDKQLCIEALLAGLQPFEVAATHPEAFFTHSRKVIETFKALQEARAHGIWEMDSDVAEEE